MEALFRAAGYFGPADIGYHIAGLEGGYSALPYEPRGGDGGSAAATPIQVTHAADEGVVNGDD